MPKRIETLILVLALAVLVAACAPARQTSAVPTAAPAPRQAGEAKSDTSNYGGATGSAGPSQTSVDRMIVRTAQLSLVVKDVDSAVEQIKATVSVLEGYVVDTRLWRQDEQLRGTVTVRVPVGALDTALAKFKGMAVKVQSESGNSQDVTEQYSDLSAQLRNLEATERELQELLTTVREKTGKAEDIMAVYRELTNIRGQIEQMKGRMQYLERTTAMSSVAIELVPDVLARPVVSTGWRPSETLAGAVRSLVQTLRFVVDALIVIIVYVLPVVAVLLAPLALIGWIWKHRRQAKPETKV